MMAKFGEFLKEAFITVSAVVMMGAIVLVMASVWAITGFDSMELEDDLDW